MKKIFFSLLVLAFFSLSFANQISIMDLSGKCYLYDANKTAWKSLEPNNKLQMNSLIKVTDKSLVKVVYNQEESIIQGPFQGKLGSLLTDDDSYLESSLNDVFKKIPNAKQGDKKIEISVQSAAVIKGNKEKLNSQVPYRWQVKSPEKKSNN